MPYGPAHAFYKLISFRAIWTGQACYYDIGLYHTDWPMPATNDIYPCHTPAYASSLIISILAIGARPMSAMELYFYVAH